jgi:hypothetical protein
MTKQIDEVKVVPLDVGVFVVQIATAAGRVRIGQVRMRDEQPTWVWEHRNGERSSPIHSSRAGVVHALVRYHRTFKPQPAPGVKRSLV